MEDEIILPQIEFSISGWTNYGANYFLNKISLKSDNSISKEFTIRIYHRTLASNDLLIASDSKSIFIEESIEGIRKSNSSVTLNFENNLVFDELYLVVFFLDQVSAINSPYFIKKIDNSAYISSGSITIDDFEISFLDPSTSDPFDFTELAPGSQIDFSMTGGGLMNLTTGGQDIDFSMTGGGLMSFDTGGQDIDFSMTGGGLMSFTT